MADGPRLSHVAHGVIRTTPEIELAARLRIILEGLEAAIAAWAPEEAAVEETFVNSNPRSALALGQARGVALAAPARAGLRVAEYAPRVIKKALAGTGAADKTQIGFMVKRLLPTAADLTPDSADALAVAICHAAHGGFARRAGGERA